MRIREDLPYANMAQATYPSPVEPSANDLAATAWKKLEVLKPPPYLTAFISSIQYSTLGALPEPVQHLE